MRFRYLIIVLAAVLNASAAYSEPFADLRAAYAARDAAAAAAIYAPDAVVTYQYEGSPEEQYIGRAAIEASFRALFDQIDPKESLDLNFRVTRREGGNVFGLYRMRIGNASVSYGRFAVTVAPDGSFASDLSTSANIVDFEDAAGSVLLSPDEENLDRSYYAGFAGRYLLSDGCSLVVTRSVVRLFVRNTCTNEWRGLARQSGRTWTAGDRVISDKRLITYRFAPAHEGVSSSVEITTGTATQTAIRKAIYQTEEVSFKSADGTKIAGTIYLPTESSDPLPASVMIHGSGPQDRDGYASIIAVIADELAANGRVVLVYDKRGSGESDGDGARATFDVLAQDATAAMKELAKRPEVDKTSIGLAGSSQAGWVAAKAIALGAKPADVLLLGAAGSAISVVEQNLYNTGVRARCAGLPKQAVRLALDQQRAFFAFLADPKKATSLDSLTVSARRNQALADWLFPDSRSTDRSANAWYVVLDPTFDPLPVWKGYKGKGLFLFGEYDDATPSMLAIERLKGAHVQTQLMPSAQHLGVTARDMCKGELSDLEKFAPQFFTAIASFAHKAN